MTTTARSMCLLGWMLVAACGSGDDGDDVGIDAPMAPVEPVDPADLGEACIGSCNLATCVLEDAACETGVCVWSEELGGAHCSRTCVETCRAGYQCVLPADAEAGADPRVCISNLRVCGNAILEFGEVCDDGNVMAEDFCAPGCDAVTQPPSGGTLVWTFHGGAPTTASGNEPVVFARREGGAQLFFGTNETAVNYVFVLPDGLGPSSPNRLLEISLTENVNGNLCGFRGMTFIPLRSLDYAAKRVSGYGEVVMTCQFGNCNFGCPQMVPHTIDFDLRWIEVSGAARQ